jgi:hypothetical protein
MSSASLVRNFSLVRMIWCNEVQSFLFYNLRVSAFKQLLQSCVWYALTAIFRLFVVNERMITIKTIILETQQPRRNFMTSLYFTKTL